MSVEGYAAAAVVAEYEFRRAMAERRETIRGWVEQDGFESTVGRIMTAFLVYDPRYARRMVSQALDG